MSDNPTQTLPVGQNKKRHTRQRRPKKPSTSEGSPVPVPSQRNRPNQIQKDDNLKSDPRLIEINKLIKKFRPTSVNGTLITSLSMPLQQVLKNAAGQDIYFVFEMKPSDPDFPFELQSLKFSLFIPLSYPFYQYNDRVTRPGIVILNNDIPRGFSVNIEIGFNEIIDKCIELKSIKKTKRNRDRKKKKLSLNGDDISSSEDEIELVLGTDLSSILLTLDKYLEKFLSREKKETIKIVRHKKLPQKSSNSTSSTPPPEILKKQLPLINIPVEILELRRKEIHKLNQRLQKQLKIKKFKATQHNDVFSLVIPLINELQPKGLIIEIDQNSSITIEKLPCRLHVPTDYLFNENKPIKLEVDKAFMINTVSQYEDAMQKLEISTRINKIMMNFNNIVSKKFLDENLSSLDDNLKHSMTSQLNYFAYNCKSFMDENFI